jgi:hypothetical protein
MKYVKTQISQRIFEWIFVQQILGYIQFKRLKNASFKLLTRQRNLHIPGDKSREFIISIIYYSTIKTFEAFGTPIDGYHFISQ